MNPVTLVAGECILSQRMYTKSSSSKRIWIQAIALRTGAGTSPAGALNLLKRGVDELRCSCIYIYVVGVCDASKCTWRNLFAHSFTTKLSAQYEMAVLTSSISSGKRTHIRIHTRATRQGSTLAVHGENVGLSVQCACRLSWKFRACLMRNSHTSCIDVENATTTKTRNGENTKFGKNFRSRFACVSHSRVDATTARKVFDFHLIHEFLHKFTFSALENAPKSVWVVSLPFGWKLLCAVYLLYAYLSWLAGVCPYRPTVGECLSSLVVRCTAGAFVRNLTLPLTDLMIRRPPDAASRRVR